MTASGGCAEPSIYLTICLIDNALTTALMEFLQEFWLFLRTRKKYWLLLLIILLVLLSSLTLLTANSALAPFIYSLF